MIAYIQIPVATAGGIRLSWPAEQADHVGQQVAIAQCFG